MSRTRGKFTRGFKRIARVGTWESLSDAAIYISIVTFAATLFFDLLIYYMFCFMEGYSPVGSGMAHPQSVFLFAMIMHILLTTAIITIMVVVVYDQVISKPVKKLLLQMRNINRGDMTDYLLSGKLSKPFAAIGKEETWIDMVQSYVDTAASEKYLDELTGCFNRKYFTQVLVNYMKMELLANPITKAPKTYDTDVFAVFLIDIDHFKKVNDDFGHAAGDEVLKRVGMTLRKVLGDVGVVIRNGGEEFLVVASAKFPYDFARTAESINESFRNGISITGSNGEERQITCSVGFVKYPLYDSKMPDLSLQNHVDLADQAMYLSKMSGRNTWHELVGNKVPPKDFDLTKFCSEPDYGVDKGYLTVRSAPTGTRARFTMLASGAENR